MKTEDFNELVEDILAEDSMIADVCENQMYSYLIVSTMKIIVKNPYTNDDTSFLRRALIWSFAYICEITQSAAYDYFKNHSPKVLIRKANEYAAPEADNDRLHNFKVAERDFGVGIRNFTLHLMLKHIISIIDILEGRVDADLNMIKEKWLDAYNYCLLFEAIKIDEEVK